MPPARRNRRAGWAALLLACAAVLPAGPDTWARSTPSPASPASVEAVPLEALPLQARTTERLIRAGGPFPYGKDGAVFGNRERMLPARPRGHYREYTVDTPGARNRGARRIVCGGVPPTAPEVCYYTDDHYASFRRIAP
jgi:ribonuclease T1